MTSDITSRLEQLIPTASLELIKTSGDLAREHGLGLCLVGGAVRDLLLDRPVRDIDLVVEGDAPKLAGMLAQKTGGNVLVHHRFRTAKLRSGESSIDFATARAESYARPGALPKVSPGSIKDDLQRRDFTINAMAIDLDPGNFGKLLDPFGGRDDLGEGLIRILHANSFIDDATRMFRAVRYEQRFDFKLETATEESLCYNLDKLNTLSGDRIRHELEHVLKEDMPEKTLQRAARLGMLKEISPSLKADGWLAEKFRKVRSMDVPPSSTLYFSLMFYNLNPEEAKEMMDRLRFPRATVGIVKDTLRLKEKLPSLTTSGLASGALYRLLKGYRLMSVQVSAIASDQTVIKERLHLYLDKLRHVRTLLNGEALSVMGIPPGPRLGEVLELLKEAKLDGKVVTREQEEDFVLKAVKTNQQDGLS